MSPETAAAAFLVLLSLPMLGPMLVVTLLLHLISLIVDREEDNENE